MTRRLGKVLLLMVLAAAFAAPSWAAQDPKDQGLADTVRMQFTVLPDAYTNQLNVSMDLYFFNDVQGLNSVAIGFKWWNENLQMTSGAFTPLGATAFDYVRFVYRNNKIDSTNKYDVFQCSGSRSQSAGLTPSLTAKHVASYQFVLSSWSVLDSLVFDTARVFGAQLTFVDLTNVEYKPFWKSKIIIYDAHKPIISNLVLSEDTLAFEATQGMANPSAQTFQITSDRNPLSFTLTEDASWLLKSPSTGTTPQSINVSVTTTGLTAGTYFDSVRVESAGASNSPRFLFVRLLLHPPLPQIGVDRTEFFFNALAGGADPAPQLLSIYNAGQSTLNWSVANSESWLQLNPASGVNAGTVTLSVSAAGLAFGQYHDTVVVSDPIAPNSPVRIPVRLAVASDLPVIVVDSAANSWGVNWTTEGPMFTRKFIVRNGGLGALDFTVESDAWRIYDIQPSASSAPDTVTLVYYFNLEEPGRDPVALPAILYDTVRVYSPNAINSPVVVPCAIRLVENAAVIQLSTTSLEFNVYECWQGYGQSLPSAQFTVQNAGGDDPMVLQVSTTSERLELIGAGEPQPGDPIVAPHTFHVNALLPDGPTGTYYDTIWVSSKWAINKPLPIAVTFNYLPTPPDAEIYVPGAPLTISYQEDSGPQLYEGLQIYNFNPGCMDWGISESLSWLTPVASTGTVPDPSPLLVEPVGYAMGEYLESFSIVAGGASNSPLQIDAILRVWKLRGDVNWNGRITVQDIACLLDYVFENEHAPLPALEVGDVDCDGLVNVGDIILVVEYLFENLEPLCGNPY